MHSFDAPSSNEGPDAIAAELARTQAGVFSRRQLTALGVSRGEIQARLRNGRWQRIRPGVFLLVGAPSSWIQSLTAACFSAGPAAAVSHESAAALWGFPDSSPRALEVTVPHGSRVRLGGVTSHSAPLPPADVAMRDRLPLTTPTRTLLDLAATRRAESVEVALDDALRRGLTSLPRLRWRLDALGRRPGSAVVRELVEARSATRGRPQSPLETKVLASLQRHGLPPPVCQHAIRDGTRVVAVVDFAYPDRRLAVEADGYAFHSGRREWEHDLLRRNMLTALGWHVIHVTSRQLTSRPGDIARQIAAALEGRNSLVSSSQRRKN